MDITQASAPSAIVVVLKETQRKPTSCSGLRLIELFSLHLVLLNMTYNSPDWSSSVTFTSLQLETLTH